MRAFSGARGEFAFAPDLLQQHVEAPLPRGGSSLHVEDRTRQLVDLALDVLDEIRHAIDEGFDQPDQHRRAVGEAWVWLAATRGEDREGARFGVAQRDKPIAGEDEGNW